MAALGLHLTLPALGLFTLAAEQGKQTMQLPL
jgi:hypothetical protein